MHQVDAATCTERAVKLLYDLEPLWLMIVPINKDKFSHNFSFKSCRLTIAIISTVFLLTL